MHLPVHIVTSSPCGLADTAPNAFNLHTDLSCVTSPQVGYLHTCFSNCFCSLLHALLLLRTSQGVTAHIHMVAHAMCQSGGNLLQHTARLTKGCSFFIHSRLLSADADSCLVQFWHASNLYCAWGRNFLRALPIWQAYVCHLTLGPRLWLQTGL